MSSRKNVNPNHYKTRGRLSQGEAIPQSHHKERLSRHEALREQRQARKRRKQAEENRRRRAEERRAQRLQNRRRKATKKKAVLFALSLVVGISLLTGDRLARLVEDLPTYRAGQREA